MSQAPEEILLEAIRAYDYPPITYDFVAGREHRFSDMFDLESYLQSLLRAPDDHRVRDGLSGVLYWGFYRVGTRDDHVKKFRERVTAQQLRRSIGAFQVLEGTGLKCLKDIGLPQFRNMTFVTKLRTFLEPERYCVLDKKVSGLEPLDVRLKRQKSVSVVGRHLQFTGAGDSITTGASSCRRRTKPVLSGRLRQKRCCRTNPVARAFGPPGPVGSTLRFRWRESS